MRNSDPILWPSTNEDYQSKQQMQKNYDDSINILQTQWYQADLDQRFAMGDQDLWGLLFPGVPTFRRKMFNFNIIHPIRQMISGYQRRNRKSSVCIPVYSPMQKTADQLTRCLYYVHNNCHGYHTYSEAFEQGALTSGIGLVALYLDYSSDPVSPDIKMRYVDFKSVVIDPYFRRQDLSDCRFIWTRQFFDRKEAELLYPQFADKIRNLPSGSYRDEKFYYMPEVYQIQFPNLIAFDEYWYLSSREATFLYDPLSGEVNEFEGDEEDLRIIKKRFSDSLRIIKKPKQTVRRRVLLNDTLVVDEANPYGLDCYPFVAFLGYFSANTPYYAYKFRGIVRDLRDAQYLYNRRKVSDLDIIESQQQGLKIKEGSLKTPDDSLNSGHGRVLVINRDSSLDDVQPMPIIPPAPTMIQMEELLKQSIREISGVNEELLGSAVDDKAGILSMLRQGAGLTTLQTLFDQLDMSQQLCGEIIIKMIQKNWSYGKVKQVINEEPTFEFDDKAFFKYGCKVIQGVLTDTQQQLELGQLLNLREILGENTPPAVIQRIIDAMYIQNKDDLKKDINEFQQQAAEQQAKMAELQMQQIQIDNETKLSYAESQKGLAAERVAKIQTDKAVAQDKLQRAEEQSSANLLNLVKTLKELQAMDKQMDGIDIEQLKSSIDLLEQITAEKRVEEKVEQDLNLV